MSKHYEYEHRPGYGPHDHMADEIIARAARQLGFDVGAYIAQCAGYASHSVPMPRVVVCRGDGRTVRAAMRRALLVARSEVAARNCCIAIVAVESRSRATKSAYVTETRRGGAPRHTVSSSPRRLAGR